MGRVALAASAVRPKNRSAAMTELLNKISALVDAPMPDLGQVERTLTDGYAHALSLEAEQWRLEKRRLEVAGQIHRGDTAEKAAELAEIARRLDGTEHDLVRLRAMLVKLRRRL
jgi:ABC-type phosphate transport system auxiliary subunit